jgi:hypothetical protein
MKTKRVQMVFTDHAIERALERLRGSRVVDPTKDMCNGMEIALRSLIEPSGINFLEGATYKARIEGYDDYRAVIVVENGIHVVKSIVPVI